jgi:hypothetical protein
VSGSALALSVLSAALSCQTTTAPDGGAAILVGAGDIADCGDTADEATARLLDQIQGTVFTAGDNAYEDGTAQQFSDCYDPTWGRHLARTRPSPGNHDYHTPDAAGYYAYFGASAGGATEGYYSYDLASWHVVVINSNIDVSAGSAQLQWLAADLASNPTLCAAAYWHHPRFSSGVHGDDVGMEDLWQVLYNAGVDVVVNGHDHDYERFALQTPTGALDSQRGIRQFVVGTGGRSLRDFATVAAHSEVRDSDTHGVLKLSLSEARYEWEFLPISGGTFRDSGGSDCHT